MAVCVSVCLFIYSLVSSHNRHKDMIAGQRGTNNCVCLSLAAFPHNWTDPDVTWGNGRGCPLVVLCWVDLQVVARVSLL